MPASPSRLFVADYQGRSTIRVGGIRGAHTCMHAGDDQLGPEGAAEGSGGGDRSSSVAAAAVVHHRNRWALAPST